MENYSELTKLIYENRSQIEFIQWSIISGVSSLIYPEYLKNIKSKQIPVPVILLPRISLVRDRVIEIAKWMITDLRKRVNDGWYSADYHSLPEFSLFKDPDLDIIIEKYITPNIISTIPNIISKKFDIENHAQQSMREDRELELFNSRALDEYHLKYIIDAIMLNLIITSPSIEKTSKAIEGEVTLGNDKIVTISNDTAICPIHLNIDIVKNPFIETIAFVTTTNVSIDDVGYITISSSESNEVVSTTIQGMGGT